MLAQQLLRLRQQWSKGMKALLPRRRKIADRLLSWPAGGQGESQALLRKPERLPVICNGNQGIFIVERHVMVCLCTQCKNRAQDLGKAELELSPTDFERHSGNCTSSIPIIRPSSSQFWLI